MSCLLENGLELRMGVNGIKSEEELALTDLNFKVTQNLDSSSDFSFPILSECGWSQ